MDGFMGHHDKENDVIHVVWAISNFFYTIHVFFYTKSYL